MWHILSRQAPLSVGQVVKLELDWGIRLNAMRLHSALHLLAGPFDKDFSKRAVAGAIRGNEAYLVFKEVLPDEIIKMSFEKANQEIKLGVEIKSYWDKDREGFRWTQVGEYSAIPDGGLHIKNTKEIGTLEIKEAKVEDGKHKIIFQLR